MNAETREALAEFLKVLQRVQENEKIVENATQILNDSYSKLVELCPHLKAIDHRYGQGYGVYRVCMTCGLEDLASEGGTPGDEYDHGYPGKPNREFWKNTEIQVADNEVEHWRYRKGHGYRVVNGKVAFR